MVAKIAEAFSCVKKKRGVAMKTSKPAQKNIGKIGDGVMTNGEWLEYLQGTLWGVLFGLVGCVVSLVRKRQRSLLQIVSSLIVSGFCGWVIYALLDGMESIPPGWVAAACGVAGGSGGIILDTLQEAMVKRVKKIGGDDGEERDTRDEERDTQEP